jgi:hypothetical protein
MAKLKRNPGFIPYIDPRQVEGDKIRKQERDRIKRIVLETADSWRREFGHVTRADIPVSALIDTLDQLYEQI